MAALTSVPCPGGCGATIRVYDTTADLPDAQLVHTTADGRHCGIAYFRIDDADLRRHALCFMPPPSGGQRQPASVAA